MRRQILLLLTLILLLFIPFCSYSQIEHGNFEVKNSSVIWQKIYQDSLPIQSQDLKLRAVGLPAMTTTFWLSDIEGAELKVDHKDGRTRLTVKDIYSVSSTQLDLGSVEENVKPTYLEEIYLNRKGEFKRLFLRKDGELIGEIIEREIQSLIDEANDNDW